MATSTSQQDTFPPSWWRRVCLWLWHWQRFIWGTFLFGLFLNLLASWVLTKGFDPKDTPLGWLLQHPLLLLSGGFLLLMQWTLAWIGSRPSTSTSESLLAFDQRNRANVLAALRKAYTEELASSLQGVARITLGLHERFDLTHPTRLTSWSPDQPEQALLDGTSIVDAYDQAGRGLLLLGAPGAGKTTLLYDLAQALLNRAEHDEGQPLPVVLNLSSWQQHRGILLEWVVNELELRYLIPRRLGQRWLQEDRFLLLLDGLDEVATSARPACVEAINTYHAEHLISLMVCSRQEEYLTQSQRLTLQSAVIVQPLSFEQVKYYLSQLGKSLAAVREVIRTNEVLKDLLTTPLMLSVVMLAYRGKTKKELPQRGDAEEQRTQIFASYLQRMLHAHGKHRTFSPQRMQQTLIWLAQQMQQRSQSVLYLERLQADWLVTRWAESFYVWLGIRLPGIMIGILVSFITVRLFFLGSLQENNILIAIGLGGLVGGLFSIRLTLVPGKSSLRGHVRRFTLVSIVVTCGVGSWVANVITDTQESLSLGLSLLDGTIWGAGVIVLSLLLIFDGFRSPREVFPTRQERQGKGVAWRHLFVSDYVRLALLVGGIFGLLVGLSDWLIYGLLYGLSAWATFGLTYGVCTLLLCFLLTRQSSTITPTEILVWSWKNLGRSLLKRNHFKNTCLLGIGTLLIAGLSTGLREGLSYGLSYGLIIGLSYGLSLGFSIACCYWFLVGLIQSISGETFSEQQRMIPNQGIWRSARNGLLLGVLNGCIAAVVFGLAIVLSNGLDYGLYYGLKIGLDLGLNAGLHQGFNAGLYQGLTWGPVFGFAAGLLVALLSGWLAWWRHWVLRLFLWREGVISWHYVRLLDEAAQRVLLRKSGGGYRFIHDLFRDYLASLEPTALNHASSPSQS